MDTIKWYKNPEMIVGLSALMIGLVTAFTSIYSAYVDREYARASVWPRLEIFRSFNGEIFSYGVTNNGTGPALIKYAKVKSGDSYIKRWNEVAQFNRITQSHINNSTLSPQSSINPLIYKGENVQGVLQADKSISIELCYCSIYDECWLVDRENRPTSVKQCTVDDAQAFSQ